MLEMVMNNRKNITMIIEKDKCCGCTACYCICPQAAITMSLDNEGFYYPKIKTEKCVYCELCVKACPILKVEKKLGLRE